MVAYALLLPELGFVIATAVAAGFLTWRLGTAAALGRGLRGPDRRSASMLVFHLILGLSLARGPLGF